MNKNTYNSETVGSLMEKLAPYSKGTPIHNTCSNCQCGSVGGKVEVRDVTDQTFGYIELVTNSNYAENKNLDYLDRYEAKNGKLESSMDTEFKERKMEVRYQVDLRQLSLGTQASFEARKNSIMDAVRKEVDRMMREEWESHKSYRC